MNRRRMQIAVLAAGMAPIVGCISAMAVTDRNWHWLLIACASTLLLGLALSIVTFVRGSEKAKTRQLAQVYKGISEALASAVAAKDSYEQDHVRRVVAISDLVARALSLSTSERDGIRIAALVHDVGKLGVSDHIMLKPGPLDPDEFAKMKNHTSIGAKILEKVDCQWDIVSMVRHHHENYDGTGYPDGLAGEQIPLGCRIISVAEVYDALVSDRCYKEGWLHQDAVDYISKLSGTHFDPAVVGAFLSAAGKVTDLYVVPRGHEMDPRVEHSCAAADEIARANQELVSLFEITQSLSSTLELDEVLGLLAQRTRRLLQTATCVVFLPDEKYPGHLLARAAAGRHAESMGKASVIAGCGPTGITYQESKPYVGEYDPNDLVINGGAPPRHFKFCMMVPITGYGEVLGTINVYNDSPGAFSNDDLHVLASVADRAALAIRNARAFEQIRDSAMKDPLTGLPNARHLRTHLENEIRRAHRQNQPVSVLAIDLDNFKTVNDTMGHQAGDTVLQQAAGIFLAQLRDYDHVARVGGDEFVVILPGTPSSEASLIASRIRRGIESYARKTVAGSTTHLAASVGVASYPGDGDSVDAILAKADAAMYEEKRARKQSNVAA